jgi:polysaccharide biosynthesis protein PslH
MRVLFLCHRIPYPPNKGDKIRAFYQVQDIGRAHEVDVFTLYDEPADLAECSSLQRYCRSVTACAISPKYARVRALPFLLTRKPLTLPYFYSAELYAAVRKAMAVRSYDRIFVYCSAMAQYVDDRVWNDIPGIVDLVDVDSDKWAQYARRARFPMSAIYRREARCLREYERQLCARAAATIVSTEREAALLREFVRGAERIHVLTNGVDGEFFSPAPRPEGAPPAVVFTGDMSYFPNQEAVTFFAREVFPLIRESVPGTQFLIVGRNPGRSVQELGAIEGIEVTGFVPDVRTYLRRASVSVAPFSIAAGIQNKILEAMASGLPVVATPRTVQGLSSPVAEKVSVAESSADLARSVTDLLRDPEGARRRGLEGRRRVIDDYNWKRSGDRLLDLLEHAGAPSTPLAKAAHSTQSTQTILKER